MGAIICQMCKQPVKNFVCINCIGADIKNWLPSMHQRGFVEFHELISSQFSYEQGDLSGRSRCLLCERNEIRPVCSFCYTNEVFLWLTERDSNLAQVFSNVFNYDFEGSGHREFEGLHGFQPVIEIEDELLDEGICEECECFSSELRQSNGKWVCETCSED